MKTPEELERLAYINGHTEIAEMLGQVIDHEDLLTEIEDLEQQLDTVTLERDELQNELYLRS